MPLARAAVRAAASAICALVSAPAIADEDHLRRARAGEFDAEATIACAQERGDAPGPCAAGVARGAGGDAAVVVTLPSGVRRTLRFESGAFVRADPTMSGTGTDVDRIRRGDEHVIRVEDQRFVLPDALILGAAPSGADGGPRRP